VVAGTFHSVGCQIVRRHVGQLGDTGRQGFNIFDQDDTKNVMKEALRNHFSRQRGVLAASTITAAEKATREAAEDADVVTADQAHLQEWVSILSFCTDALLSRPPLHPHCCTAHLFLLSFGCCYPFLP